MRFAFAFALAVAAGCSFTAGAFPARDAAQTDVDVVEADASEGDSNSADAAVDGAVAACATGYTVVSGTSRYSHGTGATWYTARAACEADGAHLVVIDDATENAFVQSLNTGGDIWIGMSDHRVEGTFVWLTGRVVVGGYESWQDQQPSDAGGVEDCVEMNAGEIWNDKPCTTSQSYVCECDGAVLPTPSTWCETGQDTSCDTCAEDCTLASQTCANQVCG